MAGIAGSPDFDSYLYSQKLRCPNWSFHHDLILIHSWDWTLGGNQILSVDDLSCTSGGSLADTN